MAIVTKRIPHRHVVVGMQKRLRRRLSVVNDLYNARRRFLAVRAARVHERELAKLWGEWRKEPMMKAHVHLNRLQLTVWP